MLWIVSVGLGVWVAVVIFVLYAFMASIEKRGSVTEAEYDEEIEENDSDWGMKELALNALPGILMVISPLLLSIFIWIATRPEPLYDTFLNYVVSFQFLSS